MNDVKDKYTLISELGSGQFGVVYKVHNKYLDRIEALKIIENVSITDNEKHYEAKVQHRLKHENIVEIYDAYVRSNKLYISMEYLDSGTLEKRANQSFICIHDVINILSDCLFGLQHIHNNGFIHRDIKPNNILMNQYSTKLSDFGLTDEMDDDRELKNPFGYSVHKAPEVLINGAYCEQSDIYSLGLTAYRVLNGDSFIRNDPNWMMSIVNGYFPPRDFEYYRPDVPKKMIEVLNKAMDVDLANRFKNAHQFRNALNQISIPIKWHLSNKRGFQQTWDGESANFNCKISVTRFLITDSYDIEVLKGTTKLRRITKLCQSKVPSKKVISQLRKLMSKNL